MKRRCNAFPFNAQSTHPTAHEFQQISGSFTRVRGLSRVWDVHLSSSPLGFNHLEEPNAPVWDPKRQMSLDSLCERSAAFRSPERQLERVARASPLFGARTRRMERSVCESDTFFPVSTRAFRHCDDAVLSVSAEALLLKGGTGDTVMVLKNAVVKADDPASEVALRDILLGFNAPLVHCFGLGDDKGFVREQLIQYSLHN